MNTTSLVLKQDGRERVRTPVARREELLAEFGRSGLSAARFAAVVGVRYQTFITRVRNQHRDKLAASEPASLEPRFVEATVVHCAIPPLVLELSAGISVQLHHASQVPLVCELLRNLARPC